MNPANKTDERLWRVPRVAKALDLSPAKVYMMAAAGEIACVRIGRSVRIHEDVVRQILRGEAQ